MYNCIIEFYQKLKNKLKAIKFLVLLKSGKFDSDAALEVAGFVYATRGKYLLPIEIITLTIDLLKSLPRDEIRQSQFYIYNFLLLIVSSGNQEKLIPEEYKIRILDFVYNDCILYGISMFGDFVDPHWVKVINDENQFLILESLCYKKRNSALDVIQYMISRGIPPEIIILTMHPGNVAFALKIAKQYLLHKDTQFLYLHNALYSYCQSKDLNKFQQLSKEVDDLIEQDIDINSYFKGNNIIDALSNKELNIYTNYSGNKVSSINAEEKNKIINLLKSKGAILNIS